MTNSNKIEQLTVCGLHSCLGSVKSVLNIMNVRMCTSGSNHDTGGGPCTVDHANAARSTGFPVSLVSHPSLSRRIAGVDQPLDRLLQKAIFSDAALTKMPEEVGCTVPKQECQLDVMKPADISPPLSLLH